MILNMVVLPELRKHDASPQVICWLTGYQDTDLFLSVVSIGEIERGIEKKRTTHPAFAALLTRWIEDLLRLYGDRITGYIRYSPALGKPFSPVGK